MPFRVKVECDAGYRGEQTPRRFWLGERVFNVEQVVDQWLAPAHRYFKFKADDGGLYILRHDERRSEWEISFYSKNSSRPEG